MRIIVFTKWWRRRFCTLVNSFVKLFLVILPHALCWAASIIVTSVIITERRTSKIAAVRGVASLTVRQHASATRWVGYDVTIMDNDSGNPIL